MGAPLAEVLRLFLLERLAHLLAAAPAQLDLGQLRVRVRFGARVGANTGEAKAGGLGSWG